MSIEVDTRLTGRRLARNSTWSLAGILTPMVAALGLIPLLIQQLGLERFGLLALIWMVVGYFSLFDLGMSKALTHQIATRLANKKDSSIPKLVASSIRALVGLGVIATLVVAMLTPWLVTSVLATPESLQIEARWSFWVMALSLPAVLVSAGLAGVLEGYQRFRALALIRIPLGISNFAIPAIIAVFTPSLLAITLALVLSRLAALAALYWAGRRHFSFANQNAEPEAASQNELISLLRFGGWITVSKIVGPILVYFDRFFISALLGLTAVAYYVTPYEILSRMMVLPQAIMAVLFPALAQAIVRQSPDTPKLAAGSSQVMILAMAPPTLAAALFAKELLALWLTPEFARESALVAQLIAAGVLVNVLARVPMTALQSAGRADISAKIHLIEVIPYLAVLWWAIVTFGIAGAALAWMLRVSLDSMLLWIGAAMHIRALRAQAISHMTLTLGIGPAVLLLAQIESLHTRGVFWCLTTIVCIVLLYRLIRPLLVDPTAASSRKL